MSGRVEGRCQALTVNGKRCQNHASTTACAGFAGPILVCDAHADLAKSDLVKSTLAEEVDPGALPDELIEGWWRVCEEHRALLEQELAEFRTRLVGAANQAARAEAAYQTRKRSRG